MKDVKIRILFDDRGVDLIVSVDEFRSLTAEGFFKRYGAFYDAAKEMWEESN